MSDLPEYITFEYIWLYLDDEKVWVIEVTPYRCTGIDEETDSYIWQPDEDNIVLFDTEERALSFIRTHGKLGDGFQCILN
jgi:hypothetical protein